MNSRIGLAKKSTELKFQSWNYSSWKFKDWPKEDETRKRPCWHFFHEEEFQKRRQKEGKIEAGFFKSVKARTSVTRAKHYFWIFFQRSRFFHFFAAVAADNKRRKKLESHAGIIAILQKFQLSTRRKALSHSLSLSLALSLAHTFSLFLSSNINSHPPAHAHAFAHRRTLFPSNPLLLQIPV